MNRTQVSAIVLGLLIGLPVTGTAQLAAPSARSFGLAGSYSARARGYEAPYWNPANLGLPGRPGWSVGIVGANASINNNSLDYGQITDLYGEYIDDATKSQILADIRRSNPDRLFQLGGELGASALAVSIWRFGFGVSDHLYPIRALAFARSAGLPLPVLNTLGDGGYVLYEGGERSVFIDGRLEVYGAERLEGAIGMTRTARGLTESADRLGVRTVLVRNRFRYRALLAFLESSPDWAPVYYDHLHQLYLRVLPETAPLVQQLGIDWSRPPDFKVDRPPDVAPADWLPGAWPRIEDSFESERLGSFFLAVGNFARARERFEQAVALDDRDLRSRLFLGLFREAEGRQAEARALLGDLPQADLDRPEVNFLAGEIGMWAGRPEQAIEYYRKAVDAGEADAPYVEGLARAAIAAGRYELAIEVLGPWLARDPLAYTAWTLRGIAALRSGDPVEARRCLERSLAIRPDQARLRRWLADPELFPG